LLKSVAADIRSAGGQAIADGNSTITPQGAQQIVQSALNSWGRVDGLVANAAIMRNAHFEDMSVDDWDAVISVNLRGMFCIAQAAYRQMKIQRAGPHRPADVVIRRLRCIRQVNYAAAKAADIGLMRSIAFEGERFGIRTNGYMPVSTTSRIAESMGEDDPMLVGRPENLSCETDDLSLALLSPERVHPMLIPLLHRSCPVNGQIFGAAGRIFTTAIGWSRARLVGRIGCHRRRCRLPTGRIS